MESDCSEECMKHNEVICWYLKDKDLYQSCLMPQLEKEYERHMTKMDTTFHAKNFKKSFSAMLDCLMRKIK